MNTLRRLLILATLASSLSACSDMPATFLAGAVVGAIAIHSATK